MLDIYIMYSYFDEAGHSRKNPELLSRLNSESIWIRTLTRNTFAAQDTISQLRKDSNIVYDDGRIFVAKLF